MIDAVTSGRDVLGIMLPAPENVLRIPALMEGCSGDSGDLAMKGGREPKSGESALNSSLSVGVCRPGMHEERLTAKDYLCGARGWEP